MTRAGQDPKATILEALRRRGSLTTDRLVEATGLSKTATRAHLLALERDGLIARETAVRDGLGRPPVAFRLTTKGGALFPTRDPELLAGLLAFLEREGAQRWVERFFGEVWEERRERWKLREGAPLAERVAALEELLAANDFMPVVELVRSAQGKARVRVRECNCPLPAAVRATKIPCRLEGKFLADVLEGRLCSAQTARDRSQTCQFDIEVDADTTD